MSATRITRVRGDDWTITGVCGGTGDLTGTATAQLRKSEDGPLTATFTATITDATTREVTLTLDDTVTTELRPGNYVYDIQVDDGTTTTTYGPGSRLTVVADVTR